MKTQSRFARGIRSKANAAHAVVASLVLGAALIVAAESGGSTNPPVRFRFAISSRLFSDVNENDAKAAIKIWARSAVEASDILIESEAVFIESTAGFVAAFQQGEIDAASMSSEQYVEVSRLVLTTDLLAEQTQADGGDVFLLLVQTQSPIRTIADLKGRDLLCYGNARANLATPWLDVLLVKQGLPRSEKFFGAIARKIKLSAVVLPVFFGAQTVCLVPKSAFDTMVELNPQLGQKLRPLATSPKFVTGVCCFRATYNPPNRKNIVESFIHMGDTVAGQQILTIFQSGKPARFADSNLDTVRELLAEHARLFPDPPGPAATATSGSPVNVP